MAMRKWILTGSVLLSLGASVRIVSATVYMIRSYTQVFDHTEVVIRGTVLKGLNDRKYAQSCLVHIDEVLSGTLSESIIQVNRKHVRNAYFRNTYQTSETLVFCLTTHPTRDWPEHSPETRQFEIIGGDGEGEFPVVDREVWVRMAPYENGESVRYAGQDLMVRKIPYSEFKTMVKQRHHP